MLDELLNKPKGYVMQKQQCPLCEEVAEFKHPSYGVGPKCFTCVKCHNYVLSTRAELLLKSRPDKWKLGLSEKSKNAKNGTVLLISVEGTDGKTIHEDYGQADKWF